MVRILGGVFMIWFPVASMLCINPGILFERNQNRGRIQHKSAWESDVPLAARLASSGLFTAFVFGGVAYAHHRWDLRSIDDDV